MYKVSYLYTFWENIGGLSFSSPTDTEILQEKNNMKVYFFENISSRKLTKSSAEM